MLFFRPSENLICRAHYEYPDIIRFADYLVDCPAESVRTVLHQGRQMNMGLWQIPPGGKPPAHRHPQGQGIWPVLQGRVELWDDENSGRIIGADESIVSIRALRRPK